jgi:hypothetical protein
MRKTYKWELIASEKEILSRVSVSEKEILWRDHCKGEGITIELSVVSEKEYLKLSSYQRRKYCRGLTISEKEILSRADCSREGNIIES